VAELLKAVGVLEGAKGLFLILSSGDMTVSSNRIALPK
jgi:hypothetical protein